MRWYEGNRIERLVEGLLEAQKPEGKTTRTQYFKQVNRLRNTLGDAKAVRREDGSFRLLRVPGTPQPKSAAVVVRPSHQTHVDPPSDTEAEPDDAVPVAVSRSERMRRRKSNHSTSACSPRASEPRFTSCYENISSCGGGFVEFDCSTCAQLVLVDAVNAENIVSLFGFECPSCRVESVPSSSSSTGPTGEPRHGVTAAAAIAPRPDSIAVHRRQRTGLWSAEPL